MSTIVVFGAGGTAGSRIAAEAVDRGHRVIAAVRRPEATSYLPAGVRTVTGDATSERSVRELAPDADALVVAIGGGERELWRNAAENLVTTLRGMPAAPRIIHLGGGSTLLTPRGTRILDEPDFPAQYRDSSLGQADALDYYRTAADGVSWTYVSPPPLEFHPGERTGHYRTGTDEPVTDDQGRSVLTYEDLAVAIVDEIEQPRHQNARFTAAY
ncbi:MULTISPECIES: NAD(P)-dependent oxidoreductase [unclassified Micromonospora]|uniref:NAD(P)-dependent oxidoreductase n=1 Tax=unclassified Micromonospora TaxID=2617518 RepID=UPI000EF45A15|nr:MULTISPECIES: NAD(P)H-binding protein [unclassified Micromonospora]RLP88588.1 NAD-dependent epimerase/dehydratase family protein [Micromonospora sp. BL4]RLP95011.1 NAD-dependent epimerase/dehydratase family protein [Micromonospora sp. CV4]